MNRITPIAMALLLITGGVFAQDTPMTLADCIQIALKGNSTIRINKNLNESAEEDVTGSYAGILPTANVSAQTYRVEAGARETDQDVPVGRTVNDQGDTVAVYERLTITQPGYTTNRNSLGVTVNQNIFDGGEWWNAISYAKSQREVSNSNLMATINSTILDVEQKFYDLLKAQKLLEVNELAVQRSQDQLNKTEKMFELGAVAKVDVYRSKVNLGNDKISMLLQKNAVTQAKHNLNLAMGRDPSTALEIKTTGLEIGKTYQGKDDLVNQGMQNNPDIQKNEAEVSSNSIQVSRSYAYLWPSIRFSFGYDRANEGIERVYSGWDKNWSIYYGVGLQLNLFNGFRDKVRIQKAKLAERNSMESFEEAKRTLKATISQYIEDFNSYVEIIDINEENLKAAQEEYRLAEERYRIGSGTQLEVREAQVNLNQAEETLVRAKYSALVTQAQMQNALGTISAKYMETAE